MRFRLRYVSMVSTASFRALAILVLGVLAATSSAQDAAVIEPGADLPEPVTAADPTISVEDLKLILKPMTVTELTSEKNAWFELVKAKVGEIAQRELAVRRQNAQIAVKKEVVDAVEVAKKAVEEAGDAGDASKKADAEVSEEPKPTGEADGAEEAVATAEAEAAKEAVAVAEADAAVEEAVAVAEENASDIGVDLEEAAASGEEGLTKAAEAVQEKLDADVAEKSSTLEELNTLRTQRAALVERLRLVLDELEKKGGAAEEARYYIKAVSSISVDVNDQEAARAAIIGWLKSEMGGVRIAYAIVRFILVLVAAWIVSRIIGGITEKALRVNRKLTRLMRDFLSVTVRRITFGLGLILALSTLGVDTAPLLAVIGAAGFVVAFALQGSLSNFASGIMILYFKPFDVGDWVEVAGISGTVSSLNLVSTTICTGDNKKVVVPNNAIWNDVITNATGTDMRRVDLVFGIGYGDDMAKAQSVLEDIIKAHPSVLADPPPNIRVHELADSSVNFIVRPWVRTEDYWPTYWDITRKVKEEFDAQGVSIPFPQRDVHLFHENVVKVEKPED